MPRGVLDGRRTVMDHDGNPLVVSGVVQYQIFDSFRAAIEIADIHDFIYTQAEATLKHVVNQYPYDSAEADCLRRDVRRLAGRGGGRGWFSSRAISRGPPGGSRTW